MNIRASLYEKAAQDPDQILDPTDVDENMFEFPSREGENDAQEAPNLLSTKDMIDGVVRKNEQFGGAAAHDDRLIMEKAQSYDEEIKYQLEPPQAEVVEGEPGKKKGKFKRWVNNLFSKVCGSKDPDEPDEEELSGSKQRVMEAPRISAQGLPA